MENINFRDHTKDYWREAALSENTYYYVRHNWDEKDFNERDDETVLRFFNFNFNENDVFLDLGCGLGYACKFVCPYVKKYIGIDFCKEMIDKAAKRNSNFKNAYFFVNDGISIPVDDKSIDVLICEQMFLHVEADKNNVNHQMTKKYLEEVFRVVKDSGKICLQLPKKSYIQYGINGFSKEELSEIVGSEMVFDIDEKHTSIYVVKNLNINKEYIRGGNFF